MQSGSKARWVRCPACAKPALYCETNPSRPFCGARCRNADLGAWASEGYRLATAEASDSDDPETSSGAQH
ncbi:MAG: DNA gyrase inhibitor YacG [Rubrivivax sp.]